MGQWTDFCSKIQQCNDIDQIRQVHTCYLDAIHAQMLLTHTPFITVYIVRR